MIIVDEYSIRLNLTTRCNKRCLHCYLEDEELNFKEIISLEDIEIFLKYLAKVAKVISTNHKTIKLINLQILGGEIFLIQDVDYYTKLFQMFYDNHLIIKSYGLNYQLEFTSNLTMNINNDLIDLFSLWFKKFDKNDILLNTSYEPDTNRFSTDKDLNIWKNNIKKFQDNNIKVGLNLVMTKGTLIELSKMTNRLKLFNLFNSEIYINFFEHVQERNNSKNLIPTYEEINKYIKIFASFKNLNKTFTGVIFDEDFLLEENNEVNHVFKPTHGLIEIVTTLINTKKLIDYKKVDENEINEIIKDNILMLDKMREQRIKNQNNVCLNCQFLSICQGGLNMKKEEQYYNNKKIGEKDFQCNGLYQYREYLKKD